MYMVRKIFLLYWADFSSQGRTKISLKGTPRPTNQPRKDPFHLSSQSPHLLQFQQSAGATPLWSQVGHQRQASTCLTGKRKALTWKTKVAILAVLLDVKKGVSSQFYKGGLFYKPCSMCSTIYIQKDVHLKRCEK